METQKTSNSQSNSEQKSNAGGIIIPNFKLYYRAITMKTAWYWHKNRQEDPDINPHIDSQLIFNKKPKTHGEKITSSTNAAGKTGYPHAED
jgi:hypothetical protein